MKKISKKTRKSLSIKGVQHSFRPIFERYPIRRATVFGSVMEGRALPSSDVDVVVEFENRETIGLFTFVRLKRELERQVGTKVDLVTYAALHPLLRKNILSKQKVIYEKRG